MPVSLGWQQFLVPILFALCPSPVCLFPFPSICIDWLYQGSIVWVCGSTHVFSKSSKNMQTLISASLNFLHSFICSNLACIPLPSQVHSIHLLLSSALNFGGWIPMFLIFFSLYLSDLNGICGWLTLKASATSRNVTPVFSASVLSFYYLIFFIWGASPSCAYELLMIFLLRYYPHLSVLGRQYGIKPRSMCEASAIPSYYPSSSSHRLICIISAFHYLIALRFIYVVLFIFFMFSLYIFLEDLIYSDGWIHS